MSVYKVPAQSLNSLQQNFTTIKFYDSRVVTKYSSNIESLNSEQTIYRYIISSHFKKKKRRKEKKRKEKKKSTSHNCLYEGLYILDDGNDKASSFYAFGKPLSKFIQYECTKTNC